MQYISPVNVFISYAHKDASFCKELEKHLKTLQRERLISTWHDREIIAGEEFEKEINRHLNQAGIILLLISSDFIASDYHWTVEVTRALERRALGYASVIPVLLRHVDWETPPIKDLSPLPKNRKPVNSDHWKDQDAAFLEIAKGIREEIKRLYMSPDDSNMGAKHEETITFKFPQTYPQIDDSSENDTTLELKLSLSEIVYGVEKRVTLEDHTIVVTVPSNSAPGERLRLRGKGPLNLVTQKRGDLYLKLIADSGEIYSIQDYKHRLYQFEKEMNRAIQLEFPLSKKRLKGLVRYQKKLNLKEEDAHFIQERVNRIEFTNRENKATVLINEAAHFAQGDNTPYDELQEAVDKCKAALTYTPGNAYAFNVLGQALTWQGKLEEAVHAYEKSIELSPKDGKIFFFLGISLERQGKTDEAINAYRNAIELNPKGSFFTASAYHNWAMILLIQGNLQEAINICYKALQVNPDIGAVAYTTIGQCLVLQEKLQEAIACFQKSIEIGKSESSYSCLMFQCNSYFALGDALLAQNKHGDAINAFREANQADPEWFKALKQQLVIKLEGTGLAEKYLRFLEKHVK